jgi:hypothetical protein
MTERDYFTDTQIASMLGVNPVTVRQWRVKNKRLGVIRYGPPYEFRGPQVVYPKPKFREWCAAVPIVNGVPRVNLPVTANMTLIAQATGDAEQAAG